MYFVFTFYIYTVILFFNTRGDEYENLGETTVVLGFREISERQTNLTYL